MNPHSLSFCSVLLTYDTRGCVAVFYSPLLTTPPEYGILNIQEGVVGKRPYFRSMEMYITILSLPCQPVFSGIDLFFDAELEKKYSLPAEFLQPGGQ